MRTVLLRGVVASVVMTVAGWCYDRIPHHTWMDHVALVGWARASGHRVTLGLTLSLVGLLLLTWAWWDLRRAVRGRPDGVSRVRLATALWSAPMLLAPPLFSGDGWSYVATGALTGRGWSPYVLSPAVLPEPLRSGVSPRWLDTPSPYGPLSLAWGGMFSRLTEDPWTLLASYRLLSVLSLVVLAWAVPALARRAGADPVDASLLAVASPFVLVNGVGGLHNDLTMAALMLAALAVTRKGAWLRGALLVGAAASVKAPGLVAAVGVVLLSVEADASWFHRVRRSVAVGAVAAVVVLALGYLTGLGTGWIGALAVPDQLLTLLAPTVLFGYGVRQVLVHLGPAGADLANRIHPVQQAKDAGMVLLALVGTWVLLVRRVGPQTRAFTSTGVVLLAAVVLSPVVHFWYFLWCVPLLACLPLGRRTYVALVSGTVTLGLLAVADPSLHMTWLIKSSALVVLAVPVAAAAFVAFRDRDHDADCDPELAVSG